MTALKKNRILFILLFFITIIILLILRLTWIQIFMSGKLAMAVERQTTSYIVLKPERGTIYDINGSILATNIPAGDVFASPKYIKYPGKVSDEIYKYLNIDRNKLYKILSNKGSEWSVLSRGISFDNANKIKKLNIPGIYVEDTNIRSYPDNNLLSQTLGYTGIDGDGLFGLEYSCNNYLKGIPGLEITNTDAEGTATGLPNKLYKPQKGKDIVLTIDSVIQGYVDKAVEKAYEKYSPAGGISAIVMNPKTGDILAISNKPDFNPNSPNKNDGNKYWGNPAISEIYEPGSVFKVVTASAALEEAVTTPDEQFYDPGYYMVSGRKINSWTKLGSINFAQAVEKSSDTVFMEIGERLGLQKLYDYIHAFGFGTPTGIDLPGEGKGMIIPPEKVNSIDLASISFGQGIAVTPLQMLTAFSATINGGYLVKPNIVKIIKDNNKIIKECKPQIVRQVISSKTSKTLKYMLQKVVDEGTGKAAQVPGYTVGGKTGTTENYSPGKYTASFAGFAPVDNPELAVIIVIKNPTKNGHMGGEIAAPVAQEILANSLRYLNIEK